MSIFQLTPSSGATMLTLLASVRSASTLTSATAGTTASVVSPTAPSRTPTDSAAAAVDGTTAVLQAGAGLSLPTSDNADGVRSPSVVHPHLQCTTELYVMWACLILLLIVVVIATVTVVRTMQRVRYYKTMALSLVARRPLPPTPREGSLLRSAEQTTPQQNRDKAV